MNSLGHLARPPVDPWPDDPWQGIDDVAAHEIELRIKSGDNVALIARDYRISCNRVRRLVSILCAAENRDTDFRGRDLHVDFAETAFGRRRREKAKAQ